MTPTHSDTQKKLSGSHYTPKLLASFVAKKLVAFHNNNCCSGPLRILDPAIGDSELLVALTQELLSIAQSDIRLYGFDTDHDAILRSRDRLKTQFEHLPIDLRCADFLQSVMEYPAEGLFENQSLPPIDLVIANPPYVRTQNIGTKQSSNLARKFKLTGRIDLYHAFVPAISSILRSGGLAALIVSNRFMTTKSGESVRRIIREEFNVLSLWDFGDTKIFDAAVLPCVLILQKREEENTCSHRVPFTSIYSMSSAKPATRIADTVIEAIELSGSVSVSGCTYDVQSGWLQTGKTDKDVWRLSTTEGEQWLTTVCKHASLSFGDIGKVRVGVKTTADRVFIRDDWNSLEGSERPETLRPIITHHIARRFRSHPIEKSILYTHEIVNGIRTPVNLEDLPNARAHLLQHKELLEARKYVVDSGRNWYEIWVPQDPDLWNQPKLVFRDISQSPVFWLDFEGCVVNGDCYWLTTDKSSDVDLLWLAVAVGNSSFIGRYYDLRFNNRLYAGRRRFITQYVERFPLPDPNSLVAEGIIQLSQEIFSNITESDCEETLGELDLLVWQAFGFRTYP